MADELFSAIALAGGALEADFQAAGYVAPNKAYLHVGGEPMLARVLRALRGSSAVGKILCVTPHAAYATLGDAGELCDEIVEPGNGIVDSLVAGLQRVEAGQRALIVATDLPLLAAGDIDGFALQARAIPCDIGYGFVERGAHYAAYPHVRHTWVRLHEGTFCGGGVSVMRANSVERLADILRKIVAARKSPLRLAALFSYPLLFKAAIGTLSIAEVERRADQISGLVCRGILCRQPELAVNVDRLQDLRTVEAILARRALH